MTTTEARAEINLRLNRETQYILAMSSIVQPSMGYELLQEKVEDNNKTLKLLGRYIEILEIDERAINTIVGLESEGRYFDAIEASKLRKTIPIWETFYRENYWDKREA